MTPSLNNKMLSNSRKIWFREWLSVFVLAFAAFIFVMAEIMPVGLLPEIGESLDSSPGSVGLVVTGYAWTVGLSAIFLTALVSRLDRRALLIVLASIFAAANILAAVSTSLGYLMLARMLGAFSHGIFWSTVGPLAVRLVPGGQRARATSIVFAGISLATVIGVPVGTMLGQWWGWRFAFALIAGLSMLLLGVLLLSFPRVSSRDAGNLAALPTLFRRPDLIRAFLATVLALTGHFAAFTYLVPFLQEVVGTAPATASLFLFVFGAAGIVGNVLTGLYADRNLHTALVRVLVAMLVVLVLAATATRADPIMAGVLLCAWGASISALTVILQSWVLELAPQASDTASAIYVAMFNGGIGTGAWLGGLLIDAHGPVSTTYAAAVAVGFALLVVATATHARREAGRRRAAPPTSPCGPA